MQGCLASCFNFFDWKKIKNLVQIAVHLAVINSFGILDMLFQHFLVRLVDITLYLHVF
jgi:hypothetical protein